MWISTIIVMIIVSLVIYARERITNTYNRKVYMIEILISCIVLFVCVKLCIN